MIQRLEAHHLSSSNGPLFFFWLLLRFFGLGVPYLDFPQGPRLCWIWNKCCKLRQWLDEMNLTSIEPMKRWWKAWVWHLLILRNISVSFYPILVPWILRTDELFNRGFQGLFENAKAEKQALTFSTFLAIVLIQPASPPKVEPEKSGASETISFFFQVSRATSFFRNCPYV